MRDQTGYYRTTPRPTPPSDAGTSERETPYPPCAYCGGSPWEHEAATTGRTICRQYRSRIVDGAAAPAAEGPRAEPVGSTATCIDPSCTACHPALPGAEAGTPDERFDQLLHDLLHAYAKLHTLPFIAEEDASDAGAAVTLALQKVKGEFAALREDKARLDAIESGEVEIECMGTTVPYQWAHGPGGDHVAIRLDRNPKTLREAIDAARLASPSPTGAP